jgi:hypothetical protein
MSVNTRGCRTLQVDDCFWGPTRESLSLMILFDRLSVLFQPQFAHNYPVAVWEHYDANRVSREIRHRERDRVQWLLQGCSHHCLIVLFLTGRYSQQERTSHARKGSRRSHYFDVQGWPADADAQVV